MLTVCFTDNIHLGLSAALGYFTAGNYEEDAEMLRKAGLRSHSYGEAESGSDWAARL